MKKTTNTSMTTKQPTKLQQAVRNWRRQAAHRVVKALYGRDMHISSHRGSLVAATAVFWYQDNGMRKFLMVRDVTEPQGGARFPGCLENKVDAPLTATLIESLDKLLGSAFVKALDHNLLEVDRVSAAPVLSLADKVTGEKMPVQGVVWLVRITKEMAQLCESQDKRIEVIAVPEFSMGTNEINAAHKVVFQNIGRHLNEDSVAETGMIVDRLEDFLRKMGNAQRQVH